MVAWGVTDQELLKKLLTDPRVSKDPRRHWPAWIKGEIRPEWPLYTWVAVQNMFTAYGSEHKRLRTLVAKAFTARRTNALRPRVEAIVDELLGELAAAPGDVVDLREKYAYAIPIQVICELLGLPEGETRTGLRRCVDSIFHTSAGPEEVTANHAEMYRLLASVVAAKRATPGDDLTSDLIAARDEDAKEGGKEEDGGRRLTEQELVDTLLLMVGAGHETTVNLLDNAIHALLTHPAQLALVRTGEASWTDVVEETLRHQAPVANLPLRYAVEDIPLDNGTVLRRGDAILAGYAAAGRDPRVHGATAGTFEITRPVKDHLSFGHGAHFCLGAPLARLEAAVALPALFARFPALTLAAAPERLEPVDSFISNGHRTLPVRLHG
ncbi:cytochrome P450 [Streptomyces gamaensis]|uniref:Cytochrome P450 n=1 Tax=Streptomyces gamaensis TaxID=1763542 RepID=A0ABW0ZBI5_9ACTN